MLRTAKTGCSPPRNSNGFMPGEGAGAAAGRASRGQGRIACAGIGFGMEKAHIDSGEPLRADGLSAAIKGALADAGCEMHDLDYRITDISGEQYYFKEAVAGFDANVSATARRTSKSGTRPIAR
ncbi:MAG: hypothetical protein MZV65_48085 [Chromatiales bacterium]|nr:hypothetical protein [Chromatiales bacterium]